MNNTPRQPIRLVFLLPILILLVILIKIFYLPPSHGGPTKTILPRIIQNLKQIDLAKRIWATDHSATNGAVVTEQNLEEFLKPGPGSTGLVAAVDAEVYVINAVGTPPEARLDRPLGDRYPKGTCIRWSTNAGAEMLLPDPQRAEKAWKPLYRATSQTPPQATPPHSNIER